MNIEFNYMPVVRINAPEFYRNKQWVAWLRSKHPATWHGKAKRPHEYSDVFFTFCDGDGSDAPTGPKGMPCIPKSIWKKITTAIEAQDISECLVWVSNLQE